MIKLNLIEVRQGFSQSHEICTILAMKISIFSCFRQKLTLTLQVSKIWPDILRNLKSFDFVMREGVLKTNSACVISSTVYYIFKALNAEAPPATSLHQNRVSCLEILGEQNVFIHFSLL